MLCGLSPNPHCTMHGQEAGVGDATAIVEVGEGCGDIAGDSIGEGSSQIISGVGLTITKSLLRLILSGVAGSSGKQETIDIAINDIKSNFTAPTP